jgi:1-acyl-sn-glycerol-3-phosphate acyltransferase
MHDTRDRDPGMRHTVFDTPVVSPILYAMSLFLLKILGWRIDGLAPDIPKYVIVGAYHTSNWDFPFALMLAFVLRIRMCWMGKNSLFRWPFGRVFRWLGGIPIERTQHCGVVAETIRAFDESERLIIAITPEGTRQKVRAWKKGFYYIALGAGVPMVPGFLDFQRKTGGLGTPIVATGNVKVDMDRIRECFAGVTPKRPELASPPFIETEAEQEGPTGVASN